MIQVKDGLVEVRAPFNIQQKEIDLLKLGQKKNNNDNNLLIKK